MNLNEKLITLLGSIGIPVEQDEYEGNEKIYIQVADNVENSDTLERELAPLKAIRESYPKIILANTKHFDYDISGIKIIDISSWLLDYKLN